jgi:hypothetical protein
MDWVVKLRGGYRNRGVAYARSAWRRGGDSNPRYKNVRQFSKLLVSATHPPLRIGCLNIQPIFYLKEIFVE